MDYVTLMGAEDVLRAGHIMRDSANDIKQSVGSLDSELIQHRLWMDNWLSRFEIVMDKFLAKDEK